MTGQIRITPEQMNERAAQYRNEADLVNEIIGRMDRLLQTLQGEWEGAASEAYSTRFAELRPSFLKAEQLIREIAQALEATARSISETDASIAGSFRG